MHKTMTGKLSLSLLDTQILKHVLTEWVWSVISDRVGCKFSFRNSSLNSLRVPHRVLNKYLWMSLDPHEQNNRIPLWKREQGPGHWRKDNSGVAGGAVGWEWGFGEQSGPCCHWWHSWWQPHNLLVQRDTFQYETKMLVWLGGSVG